MSSGRLTLNRISLGVFAPILILVGILGFVLPPEMSVTSGALPYNIFHFIFGALGVALVVSGNEPLIRAFCVGFGAIDLYQAVASFWHMFPEQYFVWTRMDDVLHVFVGVALVVIGMWPTFAGRAAAAAR